MYRIIHSTAFLFLFGLILSSCGGESTDNDPNNDPGKEQVATLDDFEQDRQPATSAAEVWILNPQGEKLAGLNPGASPRLFLNGGQSTVQSRLKDSKRKYDLPSGETLKVTYKSDGFKLKKESGELLWKVKIKEDKIKISDNEENANPYEIKVKSADRAKLVRNDAELGEAKWRVDRKEIDILSPSAGFTVETSTYSPAYAALLIEEIPLSQRMILIAELIAKGQ